MASLVLGPALGQVRAGLLGQLAAVAQALVLVLVQAGTQVLLPRRIPPALLGPVPPGAQLPRLTWGSPARLRASQPHLGSTLFQLNGTGERVFHRFSRPLPVDALRFHT